MSLYIQVLQGLAFFRARYTVAVFSGPDNFHTQGIILHATHKSGLHVPLTAIAIEGSFNIGLIAQADTPEA